MMEKENEISGLLSTLRGIAAPDDFDARVRSRIAGRKAAEETGSGSLWLFAKFAVPMVVLVVLGLFLFASDGADVNVGMVPPVVDAAAETGTADLTAEFNFNDAKLGGSMKGNQRVNLDRPANHTQTAAPGSEDLAISPDNAELFPDGVDPRRARITNGLRPQQQKLSALSVLSVLGATTACSSGVCRVQDVKENSVAERSGVKIGDVVRSIDGRPLNSTYAATGPVTVEYLEVVREGKPIVVTIR